MHKCRLGQAYCKDILTRILYKFISHFSNFIPFSMYFRTLHHFLKIFKRKTKWKMEWTAPGWEFGPRPLGRSGPAAKAASPPRASGKWQGMRSQSPRAAVWWPTAARERRCRGCGGTSMRWQQRTRLTWREAAVLTHMAGRWWGSAGVAAGRRSAVGRTPLWSLVSDGGLYSTEDK
jgi:hypothetical protein